MCIYPGPTVCTSSQMLTCFPKWLQRRPPSGACGSRSASTPNVVRPSHFCQPGRSVASAVGARLPPPPPQVPYEGGLSQWPVQAGVYIPQPAHTSPILTLRLHSSWGSPSLPRGTRPQSLSVELARQHTPYRFHPSLSPFPTQGRKGASVLFAFSVSD